MHFFYLDESGDTGDDFENKDQPIMVLGGVSVRAQGWRETVEWVREIVTRFFGGAIPDGFELHADELLSPAGEDPFAGRSRDERNRLARQVLEVIASRGHNIHFRSWL